MLFTNLSKNHPCHEARAKLKCHFFKLLAKFCVLIATKLLLLSLIFFSGQPLRLIKRFKLFFSEFADKLGMPNAISRMPYLGMPKLNAISRIIPYMDFSKRRFNIQYL